MNFFLRKGIKSEFLKKIYLSHKYCSYKINKYKLNVESFMTGESANYIDSMYNLWKKDKRIVDESWDKYFQNLGNEIDIELKLKQNILSENKSTISDLISQNLSVNNLIRAYQTHGYLNANTNPLKLNFPLQPIYELISTLDYKSHGLNEEDLSKEFMIYNQEYSGIYSHKEPLKLQQIIDSLNSAYCGSIGINFMYISSREECNYFRKKFETEWANYQCSITEKKIIFDRLSWAVLFEDFSRKKFTTHTRFGLEGLESMISGLKWLVDCCVDNEVEEITLGMAHRGRLNVLANVMRKPISTIFGEFQGKSLDINGKENTLINYNQSGDVKYHLGTFNKKLYPNHKSIYMDLLANPSHLEAVDPVVIGKVRAKQFFNNDENHKKYIAVLIHGDAAFAGQGVIYESIQMQNLKNFKVGGVIHVICNNQIGFTTLPEDCRSTPFASDILKAYECPIVQVNADDPIAVDFAFQTALEYRIKFNKDIAIDIIGYRKYGHQELDQPMFTQPQMYNVIKNKSNVLKIYKDKLIEERVMTEEECNQNLDRIKKLLEKYYQDAENNNFEKNEWLSKQWQDIDRKKYSSPKDTGVSMNKLKEINKKINLLPKEYTFHPSICKIYESRYLSVMNGKNIDMGTAEALCWASLLDEGYTVRISGQDAERGAFSHRHSILHDQIQEKIYIPLQQISTIPENFQACNSPLSEFAVLGFELGFSYYNPASLVIWEAQYGDFANGAQTIIDQFIASGERKWNVQSGIVLNLPHGMDGQGPEHSSARIERFLQMMDDNIENISLTDEKDVVTQIQHCNYQVCYPSTSANYFHLLRRQVKRSFRKPLIVAMSKKLLKFRMANSNLVDFDESKRFIKVIEESNENVINNRVNVKLIIVCSGQICYDLKIRRDELNLNNVAIITLEQLGPFPYVEFIDAIRRFPNASLKWVQEEHRNQGAWSYVRSRINNLLKHSSRGGEIQYAGRAALSAASAGYPAIFDSEHKQLLEDAFKI